MTLPVRLDVVSGSEGPLVRKVAETDLGRQRIRAEAARLERARHPGVVELLGASDAELVLAWAGTDTLATSRPTLPVAAAILAAVASTVADLHEVGIVHGRLDPGHVVLGGDGRPRLCGLRGADQGQVPSAPADDVAALGRLIDHLVGSDAELEPIPDRRWARKRWSGYIRRGLLTLADQAIDADPARRPTARTLAAAIADTVPEAHLAPPTADSDRRPPSSTSVPVPAPAPAETEEEPVTATFDLRAVDHDPVPDPTQDLAPDPKPEAEPEAEPVEPDVVDEDARVLGLRIDPGTATVGGDRMGGSPRTRPVPTSPAASARPARHSKRLLTYAAAGVLILAALAGWARPGPRGGQADRPDQVLAAPVTSAPVAATSSVTTSPPSTSADPGCPSPTAGHGADVDGDGCTESVSVQGNRITADGATFEIGVVGDAVAIGDWDCDGVATPGVVRPASGEVFLFDRWTTEAAAVTVQATTVVPGARSVEVASAAGTDRCAGTVVRLADGTTSDLVPGGAP